MAPWRLIYVHFVKFYSSTTNYQVHWAFIKFFLSWFNAVWGLTQFMNQVGLNGNRFASPSRRETSTRNINFDEWPAQTEVVNQFKNAQQPHKQFCMQLGQQNWLQLCHCQQFVAGILAGRTGRTCTTWRAGRRKLPKKRGQSETA